MRTYEFRTWDIVKKKMLPYLTNRRDGTTIAMQYIGQTDNEGIKIFEGDKVQWYMPDLGLSGDGEVVYSEGMAAYMVLDTKQGISMPVYRIKAMLVTGNIYEQKKEEERQAV